MERRRLALRSWNDFSREYIPPPGHNQLCKKYFLAGYVRGKASIIGFAIIYCVFATIMAITLGIIIVLSLPIPVDGRGLNGV